MKPLVLAFAELSAVFGSDVEDATLAVSVTGPAWPSLPTSVTFALAPEASVPREHVTFVVPEHVPTVVVADTNVSPAGSVSVTLAFVAGSGPWLVATIVK